MILAIDVQYSDDSAYVAGVMFDDWSSSAPSAKYVSHVIGIEDYVPGSFYKRELPCILRLLEEHQLTPKIIVVDGYVYLDENNTPGLGKHLFDSLAGSSSIVGVAKKAFTGIGSMHEVFRGKSKNALYITSTDALEDAKSNISTMHGPHRIPTLLKRADQLCREAAKSHLK